MDMQWQMLAHVGWQLACGVEAASARRLVHCDYKQENVMAQWDGQKLRLKASTPHVERGHGHALRPCCWCARLRIMPVLAP